MIEHISHTWIKRGGTINDTQYYIRWMEHDMLSIQEKRERLLVRFSLFILYYFIQLIPAPILLHSPNPMLWKLSALQILSSLSSFLPFFSKVYRIFIFLGSFEIWGKILLKLLTFLGHFLFSFFLVLFIYV